MVRYLRKLKKFDSVGKIMALDIGRKFVGTAISTRDLKTAMKHKTFEIDPQYNYVTYDYRIHSQFYMDLENEMRMKKIKALIIGYPKQEGTVVSPICQHVKSMVEFLIDYTFISNYHTPQETALKILNNQGKSPDRFFLQSAYDSLTTKGSLF
eukprot:CAMPEP_0168351948 /NCGR_PEP_ID=MMETSP0213-20121227/22228_1 /TAXON_ID=151035 /ORGANISM="Euplotes harpa, Strain FSP1.4" /LENGTH=152 /DNA_ID=CAMNT_0008363003 /DNA_START=1 /DNA_END=456 /DNA_ORIENTATION=+